MGFLRRKRAFARVALCAGRTLVVFTPSKNLPAQISTTTAPMQCRNKVVYRLFVAGLICAFGWSLRRVRSWRKLP